MLISEESILILVYHILTKFFPLLVGVAQEEPVEPVVEGDEEEGVVKVACRYIYFKL